MRFPLFVFGVIVISITSALVLPNSLTTRDSIRPKMERSKIQAISTTGAHSSDGPQSAISTLEGSPVTAISPETDRDNLKWFGELTPDQRQDIREHNARDTEAHVWTPQLKMRLMYDTYLLQVHDVAVDPEGDKEMAALAKKMKPYQKKKGE